MLRSYHGSSSSGNKVSLGEKDTKQGSPDVTGDLVNFTMGMNACNKGVVTKVTSRLPLINYTQVESVNNEDTFVLEIVR